MTLFGFETNVLVSILIYVLSFSILGNCFKLRSLFYLVYRVTCNSTYLSKGVIKPLIFYKICSEVLGSKMASFRDIQNYLFWSKKIRSDYKNINK